MKFDFVAKHRVAWPVGLICEALGVSRSGFYAWLSRPRSQRSRTDEVMGTLVRQSFIGSDRTYGARRVWHDVLALGHNCGLHRIERLMREQALRARPRRRGLPQDGVSAVRLLTTFWTASSRLMRPTRSRWLTSPTSGQQRVGFMRLRFWTCTHGESWGGPCTTA